jgi:hypothetical protein
MRSKSGFFAAIAFLSAVPAALIAQLIFGQGAETVLHFICGIGFALSAVAVFDFKLPKWMTWIGFLATSIAAVTWLLQGVSNLVPSDWLHQLAFQVLGQGLESLTIDLFILWFVAVVFMDSQGKTKIFGMIVLSIAVFLELYRLSASYLGGSAPESLKLVYLLVFVWFLLESKKGDSLEVREMAGEPQGI